MDKKALLGFLVKVLTLLGLVVVAYPFFAALTPPARSDNESLVLIELPPLVPGTVYSVEVKGVRLFVLKPNEAQTASIKTLDAYVSSSSLRNYRSEVGAYVYWGYSSKWGCPLEHKPPQSSRLHEWHDNAKWLGGYWDAWCEVSYDYAGRAINQYEYTFNGYTWPHRGLDTPEVFERSGDKYLVSIYQRNLSGKRPKN